MITRLLALAGLLLLSNHSLAAQCLTSNSGSAEYPPLNCSYSGPLEIINGLPPGTTIEIAAELGDFSSIVDLGGGSQSWNANIEMMMTGTGALAGFSRTIFMPVAALVDLGPRAGGDTQSFDIDILGFDGQVFGDPDFDVLRFTSGSNWGLPSSGSATYTAVGGVVWDIESSLALNYQIEFQGAPGGALEGFGGVTTSATTFALGEPAVVPLPAAAWLFGSALLCLGVVKRKKA